MIDIGICLLINPVHPQILAGISPSPFADSGRLDHYVLTNVAGLIRKMFAPELAESFVEIFTQSYSLDTVLLTFLETQQPEKYETDLGIPRQMRYKHLYNPQVGVDDNLGALLLGIVKAAHKNSQYFRNM